MGLRFRQSFKLFPGVRLNLSARGVSASFGVPGATVNVGPRGVRSTVGIPGTGLSYSTHHGGSDRSSQSGWPGGAEAPGPVPQSPLGVPQPAPSFWQATGMREIGSASVEQLTSHSLVELRDVIAQARLQRHEVDEDLAQAKSLHQAQSVDLDRRKRSLFRFFYKRRIGELEAALPETAAEIERLEAWHEATHVDIKFETSDAAKKAYAAVVRAFDALRTSASVWDITSDRDTHRVIERTSASRMLTRHKVTVDFSASDLVRFEGRAMKFQNVNGEDILLYPGMAMMPRPDGAFALIDLRELQIAFQAVQFIEEEAIPADTKVVGETWAKVNKNGTPDLRFRDNYRIPICLYGRLLFTSPGGIEEEFQFSNVEAAGNFSRAFDAYKAALSTSDARPSESAPEPPLSRPSGLTLWENLSVGMTPQEVLAAQPDARRSDTPSALANGATADLIIPHYSVGGEPHTLNFYFSNGGLVQVTATREGAADLSAAYRILAHLRAQYGPEHRLAEPENASFLRKLEAEWIVGDAVNVGLVWIEDVCLNVNHQARLR